MVDGRVLLVQDDISHIQLLEGALNQRDCQVAGKAQALNALGREAFDLIVVNVQASESNVLDYCKEIKSNYGHIPLMLIGNQYNGCSTTDALNAGVDDYMTGAINPNEFAAQADARIRLKMSVEKNCNIYRFGDVFVDLQNFNVYRNGEMIKLSGMACSLLRYFIEHQDHILSRSRLLQDVWGYHGANITRTVDMHVSKLRKRMEHDPRQPRHFLTVQGKGYKFVR